MGHQLTMKILTISLIFIIQTSYAKEFCRDLNVGSSTEVTNYSSKTGLAQKYTLRRFSRDTWQVFLNIDFNPAKNTSGKKTTVIREMEKRVRECFLNDAHFLKDEKGRMLRMFLYEKKYSKMIDKPREVNIKIVPKGERSNSQAWARDANCPTIIHEALHLLGLVDEYEEKSIKVSKKIAYNCRHLGPENSIMKSISYRSSSFDHILFSAQMDVILYPNCEDKNEIYYQCSKNAYKTSKNGKDSSCPSSPSECYDETWLIN